MRTLTERRAMTVAARKILGYGRGYRIDALPAMSEGDILARGTDEIARLYDSPDYQSDRCEFGWTGELHVNVVACFGDEADCIIGGFYLDLDEGVLRAYGPSLLSRWVTGYGPGFWERN